MTAGDSLYGLFSLHGLLKRTDSPQINKTNLPAFVEVRGCLLVLAELLNMLFQRVRNVLDDLRLVDPGVAGRYGFSCRERLCR